MPLKPGRPFLSVRELKYYYIIIIFINPLYYRLNEESTISYKEKELKHWYILHLSKIFFKKVKNREKKEVQVKGVKKSNQL